MEVSKPKTQTSFQFGGGEGVYYPPNPTPPPPLKPVSAAACRRSATMSNASLFCGTLEPRRMRWECGQVRVTRLRKGSNCAGVQRCQVCAPINKHTDTQRERRTCARMVPGVDDLKCRNSGADLRERVRRQSFQSNSFLAKHGSKRQNQAG